MVSDFFSAFQIWTVDWSVDAFLIVVYHIFFHQNFLTSLVFVRAKFRKMSSQCLKLYLAILRDVICVTDNITIAPLTISFAQHPEINEIKTGEDDLCINVKIF